DPFVLLREDRAEGRGDDVEALVLVRERLRVALVEADREACFLRRAARLAELVGGDVLAGDLRAGARGRQRHPARAGGDVEKALARLDAQRLDELRVDRREALRNPLVGRAAPLGGGVRRRQSFSFARFVSSVRTFQSSG